MIQLDGKNLPQFIDKDILINLVPHKGKMFLLSRVTSYSLTEHSINTEFDINKDCIFYDSSLNGIPSWCTFEIMAQGISALSSLIRIADSTLEKANPGVVLSVTGFSAQKQSFSVDSTLYMTIKEDYRADNVYKYNCFLYTDKERKNEAVKTCITVMEIQNIESFMQSVKQHY